MLLMSNPYPTISRTLNLYSLIIIWDGKRVPSEFILEKKYFRSYFILSILHEINEFQIQVLEIFRLFKQYNILYEERHFGHTLLSENPLT